jgi:hypothetical protein
MRLQAPSKLIVSETSKNTWNYLPMRSGPAKYLSDLHTFVDAKVDEPSGEMAHATRISAFDEIDPSSGEFPDVQMRLDAAGKTQLASELASSPKKATMSKYKTRQRGRMLQNVGILVCRVFSINGPMDPPILSKVLLGL